MQTNIKPWAENGTKVAMDPSEVETGWSANDQPAAENWNAIQNERDLQQIADAEARAVRLFGLAPGNLRGNDDSGIPIFRPNAFSGSEDLWNPSSIMNKYEGLRINSASLGWDPANKMPVLVTFDGGSLISPGALAQLRFFHAWDYSPGNLTPEDRDIQFGFVSDSDELNMPLLISNGFLFISVAANATGNRYLLKYDLTNWTGNTAGVILQSNRPVNVTEIVDLPDGYIGLFEQFTTNVSSDINRVRFNKIKKDFSAQSMSTAVAGCTVLSKTCRTDGLWSYSYGQDASGNPVVIAQELDSFTTSPEIYAPGGSYSDNYIADLMPLLSGEAHPSGNKSVVCLVKKSTAPYGPFFRIVGRDTFAWTDDVFNILSGDTDFYFTTNTFGSFCCFGSSTFVALNRSVAGGEGPIKHLELIKIERSQFLRAPTYPYLSANSVEGVVVGENLTSGSDEAFQLHTRCFHDGRAVWVIDCYNGIAYRVVAPEIRCGK